MDLGGGGGGGRNGSEFGGYHQWRSHSEPSCSNKNDSQSYSFISRKIVFRRTIYFITFASACFLLYLTFDLNQYYYLPISNNPPSRQSRQNNTKSNPSSFPSDVRNFPAPTDEIFQVNSTPVSNNSLPYAPMHDFLPANSSHVSNISTPTYAPMDSSLQGNSSSSSWAENNSIPMYAPTGEFLQGKNSSTKLHAPRDDFIPENSSPVLDPSSSTSAPADNQFRGNYSPVFNISSPIYPPDKLSTHVNKEPHDEEAKLEKMLSEAAMDDKTVIVTTVNAAWTAPHSLFDLFLESFKFGNETQKLLNHLVVIALDQKGYSRCLELHPHCVALTTEGVDFSGEAFFMTEDYVKLVWRKIEFVLRVLQMGYNSIFTDTDILWLRDPFPHFHMDADIQTSCDRYGGTPTLGTANTGFYYVKSNNRTVQFYKFWLASRDRIPHEHDQDVFNKIRFDPLIKQSGITIKLLNTAFFGGFCQPSKDLNLVCTMHANCCVGINHKLHDLKMLIEDWKKYLALPGEEKARTPQTWTIQSWCR